MADLSANMRGALYMLAVTACFTCGDAFVRAATEELPLFQVVFLRGLIAAILMGVLAYRTGAFAIRVSGRDKVIVGLRSMAEVCAMIPFFIALANMPFANVSAILQALPLTLTLAGAVFLGEPVGWRRLTAIVVGLVGVLLIVQPGGDGFSRYSLLVLLAVAFVTFRDLSTRRISSDVPALLMAFIMALFVLLASGVLSLMTAWQPISPRGWALILGAGLFIIGGYTFSALAMRNGEIGFVTPFRYVALVWAVLIGFLAFGEWPDPLTWAGASIVVATGLYTLYRERVVMARKARSA